MTHQRARRRFLGGLFSAMIASAQARTWTGQWAASAGGRQFAGAWLARESGRDPKDGLALDGTWNLVNRAGQVLMTGTWNARKREGAWDGTWTAQPENGPLYEGTWIARVRIPPKSMFADMLDAARKAAVSGSWEARTGLRGGWTIWTD